MDCPREINLQIVFVDSILKPTISMSQLTTRKPTSHQLMLDARKNTLTLVNNNGDNGSENHVLSDKDGIKNNPVSTISPFTQSLLGNA